MTQKNKTILLIIVAIGVWGYTALEWFSYIKKPEASFSQNQAPITTYPKEFYAEEVDYQIQLDYLDPFLKTKSFVKTHSSPMLGNVSDKNNGVEQPSTEKRNVDTTNINSSIDVVYNGFIEKKGAKYAILKINSNSYILKNGESAEGIIVKSITENNIVLNIKGMTKAFPKK